MILDMNGKALVGCVKTGAFRYRPAQQRALVLEPEIVVVGASGVLLNQIAAFAAGCAAARPCGLRSPGEIAFGPISLKPIEVTNHGRDAMGLLRAHRLQSQL